MKTIWAGVLLFLLMSGSALAADSGHLRILHVTDGRIVTFNRMVDDLKTARLVFVGELHDSEADHRLQLQVIRALGETGAPLAIGLEMFRSNSQQDLDRWLAGRMRETAFLKVFYENWSQWPLYRPIFDYAKEKRIPMIGLNVPNEIPAQVAREGFASLSSHQRRELPSGLTCNAGPVYRKFIRRALRAHFQRKTSFVHFCEAQMVWDGVMAQALLRALKTHPRETIVVLTGIAHAWKYGIPAKIREEKAAVSLRVVLPEIPGRLDASDVTAAEADYLVIGLH